MDEIVKDFLIESNENLDRLDQELVKLEVEPSSKELLASIFRTIHTIKGSCGFLGFANLEKWAHAGESSLSLLRDGKLALTLTSRGPGLWSGQSGKELVLAEPFLHPETERQATEVGRYGSGVWLEHRSLAWSQVPCAEQWLTVG